MDLLRKKINKIFSDILYNNNRKEHLPKLAKNTEKLRATPNQKIKKREGGFVVVKTPFILPLTPNALIPDPHPPKHPSKLAQHIFVPKIVKIYSPVSP